MIRNVHHCNAFGCGGPLSDQIFKNFYSFEIKNFRILLKIYMFRFSLFWRINNFFMHWVHHQDSVQRTILSCLHETLLHSESNRSDGDDHSTRGWWVPLKTLSQLNYKKFPFADHRIFLILKHAVLSSKALNFIWWRKRSHIQRQTLS